MSFCSRLLAVLLVGSGAGTVLAQPKVDGTKPLTKITFGSCNDQDKPCPIWDAVIKDKPQLLLLLGDNIYADLDKSKKVTPELIKSKYDTLDAVPAFKTIKNTIPIMAMWDDHDMGKNDGDSTWHLKDESQQLFLDFFQTPKDSVRRSRKGIYYSEIYGPPGKRVQVIMLDGRYFLAGAKKDKYSPKLKTTPYIPTTEPGATILGEEQWKWFEEQLKQPADIRLICSGTQVLADEHPYEKWANFPNERARLYKLLKDTKANGVVILSGDRHLAELSLSTDAIGYPLYDITSSGFNQATKSWRPPEKNQHRVAAVPFGNNYGVVEIDWTRETSPLISLQLRGEEGEVLVRHDIRAGMLTPNPQSAKADDPPLDLPEGVISATDALTKVGEDVTIQFVVKASNKTKDGKRMFLNSDADFKGDKNFTVVITGKALTEGRWKDTKPEDFKGKMVRVMGKVSKFNDKPQLVVEDEKSLEIVKK